MFRLRYRHKVRLRKLGRFLLIAMGLLIVGLVVVMIYADTLVTYHRDGAHLTTAPTQMQAEAVPTEPRPVINNPIIEIQAEAVAVTNIMDVGGVYITTSMLKDIDKVTSLIKSIEEPCGVMIELKSDFGNFYYSSNYANGNHPEGIDIGAVDDLLAYMKEMGFYMIASIPAFPDRAYVLENENLCIRESGGYGWMDSRGCYWLDPSNDAVISHLMQITRELTDRGFQEICYTSFKFPGGSNYVYGSDKSEDQIISEAAKEICEHFSKSEIIISFVTQYTDFPVSGGRVYISGVDGSQVEPYAAAYGENENVRELVFMTGSKDARFDHYAVLSPLMSE